ncbi:MAG: ABC transporter ATP-binding protein [Bernardetiaceae bacterium]
MSQARKDITILSVRDLTIRIRKDQGEVIAVDQISFQLKQGETLGIVGESGSGKTLTALSLLSLIPKAGYIEKGDILFESKRYGKIDLTKVPKSVTRRLRGDEISMIFQEPMSALNPVYTCGVQLIEGLLYHNKISRRAAKQRALELLERVQIGNPEVIFQSYPHQLSGGQIQRVVIAMALASQPLLLIADEPTTALDVTVQASVLSLLRQMRDELDTSMVFITHDLGVVAEVADRVMVMFQGKVVEEGTVWDIFSNPQHPYTKGLLACRPRLDIKLKVLPVVSEFMHTDEKGNISTTDDQAKFKSVGQALMLNYQSEAELRERYQTLLKKDPIMEVKHLHTYYRRDKGFWGRKTHLNKAVDDISFKVYPGETLGIVGESGCGKSTLVKSILRLIEPDSGEVFFRGEDILKLPKRKLRYLRKDIQIVFQDPFSSLNPRITIGEAIMEPMRIHSVLPNDQARRDYVVELLETVNLSGEQFNRYPHEFSGGQRQRICIARALAVQPRFLICDESVSALDVSVQAQVLNLLNRLKDQFSKQQLTYIFISHDLSVVKFIADRILVMRGGKIEESGFSEDIYAKPEQPYTRQLIDSIPKGDLETIRRTMIQRKLQQKKRSG